MNKYVNLVELAELIRNGEEISVINNETGEDITAFTLAQIIMDREKKEGYFLPCTILSALIQAGGGSINTIRQKLMPPPDFIQQVDEEINKWLQGLIQRGDIAEDVGKKIHGKIIENSLLRANPSLITHQEIQAILARHNVPSREEFQQLFDQVDKLAEKMDKFKK
jgi:polyhydroxyalkanoate synthesis regulator protein